MDLNKIYNENCIDTLSKMEDNFLNGIITSPPYNIATERKDCYYDNGYAHLDNLSEEKYLNIRLNEFKQFSRVLKDNGTICYNISYSKENPILPILLVNNVHQYTNLTLAEIITWKKKTAIPFQTSPNKLSRITEPIYVFVKKSHLHTYTANKQISKVNEKTKQKFYKNYTNIIYADNNDGYKSKLKASFSQDLVNQLLDIYYPQNSIIYDPFIGIGTTALSCIKNNRQFIGSELIYEHFNDALNRINHEQNI